MLNPLPRKWCVIVGAAGGLGHLAIQYAKAMDLRVIAVDGGLPEKEFFCMRMGADVYVDFTRGGIVELIQEKTQGGADYALVLSPSQTCYRFVPPSSRTWPLADLVSTATRANIFASTGSSWQ